MKAKAIIVLSVLLMLSLSGCSDNKSDVDKTGTKETVPLSKISINTETANNILSSYSNLRIADDFVFGMSNDITQVYEYTMGVPSDIDMEEYYNEFKSMFEYLFPGHVLNNEFLFYIGDNSSFELDYDSGKIVKNYNKVSDWYNKVISGEEGRVAFLYDESWFRNITEWNSPVCLVLGNPIGYGYAVINKGKTEELGNCKVYDKALKAERYATLESCNPIDFLTYIATYAPDSKESYKLLDKEIPINEAVDYYEHYINGLPYPRDKNFKTVVISVEVYKVTDNVYGYYFLTDKEYQGVPFDYIRDGTQLSNFIDYTSCGGNAFMVESDDVDVVYAYYANQYITSETAYKEIIPFEKACQIISEKMTDIVVFEVQRAELIYSEIMGKTSDGYVDVENPTSSVSPTWKFTLHNPNDIYDYICYVDAVDGENFRYYRTPSEVEHAHTE